MAATTAATSMTLGGLIKHMALVKADWLVVKLACASVRWHESRRLVTIHQPG